MRKNILIAMNKNAVQWFLGSSAYIVLGLIGLLLNPSVVHTRIIAVVWMAVAVDAIVFFVGYGIFQKLRMLEFWKFALYLTTKAMVCLAIYFWHPRIALDNVGHLYLLMCVIFAVLNIVLWKILFRLTLPQACWTGVMLAFINTFFFGVGGLPIIK